MKKGIRLLLIYLFVICGAVLLTACTGDESGGISNITQNGAESAVNTESAEKATLGAPEDITFTDYYLTWKSVNGAVGYTAIVDGEEYHTQDNSLDLFNILKEGRHFASVCAEGDGVNYDHSEYVDKTFDLTATANLNYELLPDNSGYEVSKGSALLNGRIYIPDTHNGKPVLKIADEAFNCFAFGVGSKLNYETGYGCNITATGFRLPSKLKEIGAIAFHACAGFKEIIIPDSVETLGGNVFMRCGRLESVNIPEKITEIPANFFLDCNITAFEFAPSITSVGAGAFQGCPIKSLVIPDTLKKIGDYAFSESGLEDITFPQKLEFDELYGSAFVNTPWFESQPDGCVTVGDILLAYKGALPEDGAIKDEDIPQNVKRVAGAAFYYLIKADNLTQSAHFGRKISSIYFRDGISFLGGYVCASPVVRLPSDLKVLPEQFWGYAVKINNRIVVLPDGIEYVCKNELLADYIPNANNTVIIPKSVKYFAFVTAYMLYEGSEEEWRNVETSEDLDIRLEAFGEYLSLYFYSEAEPDKAEDGSSYVGKYWHYDENGDPVIWSVV